MENRWGFIRHYLISKTRWRTFSKSVSLLVSLPSSRKLLPTISPCSLFSTERNASRELCILYVTNKQNLTSVTHANKITKKKH